MDDYFRNDKTFRRLYFLMTYFFIFTCFFCIVSADATTTIFYPIMDGQQSRVVANQTFLQTTLGAGTTSSTTATTGLIGVYTVASTAVNNFSEGRKCSFTFDLQSVPTGATIQSAYLRYVVTTKTVTLGTPDLVVVRVNATNPQIFATADYSKYVLSPVLSANMPSAEIIAGYEVKHDLNNAGWSLITSTLPSSRYLQLGLVTSWEVTGVADYSLWGTARSAVYTIDLSEFADTVNDPYLSITYSSGVTPDTSGAEQEKFFATINLWILIFLALIFVVAAIYTRINVLSFVGSAFCLLGMIGSLFTSFISGLIFIIMLVVTLYIGFTLD